MRVVAISTRLAKTLMRVDEGTSESITVCDQTYHPMFVFKFRLTLKAHSSFACASEM